MVRILAKVTVREVFCEMLIGKDHQMKEQVEMEKTSSRKL